MRPPSSATAQLHREASCPCTLCSRTCSEGSALRSREGATSKGDLQGLAGSGPWAGKFAGAIGRE